MRDAPFRGDAETDATGGAGGILEKIGGMKYYVRKNDKTFHELSNIPKNWLELHAMANKMGDTRTASSVPVFVGKSPEEIQYVLKLCRKNEGWDNTELSIENERTFTAFASNKGFGATLHGFEHTESIGVFLLEYLPQGVCGNDNGISGKIRNLLQTMLDHGHYHLDLNVGNLFHKDGAVVAIDHGRAVYGKGDADLTSVFLREIGQMKLLNATDRNALLKSDSAPSTPGPTTPKRPSLDGRSLEEQAKCLPSAGTPPDWPPDDPRASTSTASPRTPSTPRPTR
jgi:hypothetical protein